MNVVYARACLEGGPTKATRPDGGTMIRSETEQSKPEKKEDPCMDDEKEQDWLDPDGAVKAFVVPIRFR